MFSALISVKNKLVAYSFAGDSGLNTTGDISGSSKVSIFSNGLNSGIGLMISAFLSLIGIIFLGLIIYAGLQWMTAEGNETRIEKAKKILTGSTIGLILVLAAYAISYFVIKSLAPSSLK